MAVTYDGGWEAFTELHQNNGEFPQSMLNEKVSTKIGLSDLKDIYSMEMRNWYPCQITKGSYKILQSALSRAKCGPITTYHGMEYPKTEILNQLNKLLGIDQDYNFWKDIKNKEILRKSDLTKLKDQVLDFNGFCCTSIDKGVADNFLDNDWSGEYKNIVLYEISIDEKTQGAYTSDDDQNHLFYGRTLVWHHECQILLNNKLKLKVEDAYWTETKTSKKNVLYLKVQGYH